jgi:hypothetical protein
MTSGADALRTSIAKMCIAAGIPLFSPHDLRHRRISLLHLRGVPWARTGEMVGQHNLAVTANTHSHVMLDEAEVDYGQLLRDARWRVSDVPGGTCAPCRASGAPTGAPMGFGHPDLSSLRVTGTLDFRFGPGVSAQVSGPLKPSTDSRAVRKDRREGI